MAHVPVVSCDFPEVKAIVDQGVGIAVNSHDVNQIADAVNKMVSDENLREQYSEKCKEIKKIYNWENEKEKLLEVYSTL